MPALRLLRTAALVLVLAATLLLVAARPASADPAGPTDYRSRVTGVEPPSDAVRVQVVGGDSFLRFDVEPGHELVVLGYEDEPYLRVLPDGTVQENRRSPATYLNADRYGNVAVPADVDPEADPDWQDVAAGGTYVWHDHRIHWMSRSAPSSVTGRDRPALVQPWSVGLLVDGEPVDVSGELVLYDAPSPLPWLALAAAVGVGLGLLAWRRPVRASAPALLVVSALALYAGWSEWSDVPSYVRSTPLVVVTPALALVAAGVAVALRRSATAAVVALLSAGLLVGWVVLRWSVLFARFLPTPLSPSVDRAIVAVTAGASVASVVVILATGAFRPALPEDDTAVA